MMNSIVNKIQEQFIHEAIHSPLLLSDLASMETYIAESYRDRSFIELLQNADDAGAKRFLIKRLGHFLIVSNDGRPFAEEDIIAVCRSGASTKKRGGSTIGYRGIGFKSVVNLAERVHIVSGELRMTFCRKRSGQLLNMAENVPLIRIPHLISEDVEDLLEAELTDLIDENYTTFFIFEHVKQSNLDAEFEDFDSSSLLFLRNVRQVEFLSDFSKIVSLKRKIINVVEYISIIDNGIQEDWMVYRGEEGKAAIALLIQDSAIRFLEDSRSVIHSFMPTKDSVGLPIKIHGDFSTDPSRTKVAQDENSEVAFERCAKLLVDLIKLHLSGKVNTSGLFEILETMDTDTSSILARNKPKKLFINSFKNMVSKSNVLSTPENLKGLVKVKLKPDWLNLQDYLQVCKEIGVHYLEEEVSVKHPGLLGFMDKIGVKTVTIADALESAKLVEPTETGGAEMLAKCIQDFRFNLPNDMKQLMIESKFIKFENEGTVALNDLKGIEKINSHFYQRMKTLLSDIKDLIWFFKQIGAKVHLPEDSSLGKGTSLPLGLLGPDISVGGGARTVRPLTSELKGIPSIRKWRSAETNLSYAMENEPHVLRVVDVSKSNLGYDLEVHKTTGIDYVEVKSVDEMGASFSLTNNEYATANELSDRFIIAIVKQTNYGLDVCFIRDPITTLALVKRVTRWEWICDEYEGTRAEFPFSDL